MNVILKMMTDLVENNEYEKERNNDEYRKRIKLTLFLYFVFKY